MGVWKDNNNIELYVDGILHSSSSSESVNFQTADRIGIGYLAGSDASSYFNGTIDDVRVYNKVFSSSEISELYNNENIPKNLNVSIIGIDDDNYEVKWTWDQIGRAHV